MSGPRIDLQVKRDLLDPLFDGYKYSVECPSFESKRLPEQVSVVARGSEMFSLQHIKTFANVNYLFFDDLSSTEDTLFLYTFVDGHVAEIIYQVATQSTNISNVAEYKIGGGEGSYPPSILFVQNHFAIVCNGLDDVTIFLTKTDSNDWIRYNNFVPCSEKGINMIDAKFVGEQLHVLCTKVLDDSKPQKRTEYLTNLIWTILSPSPTGDLVVEETKHIYQRGHFEVGNITNDGKIVIIATKKPAFSLTESVETLETHVFTKSWTQSEDDVEVRITLPPGMKKEDVNLKVTAKSIFLTIGDNIVMDGSFDKSVDPEKVSFEVVDDHLTLKLTSTDGGKWTKLLEADVLGSENEKILGDVPSDVVGDGEEECDESEPILTIYWLENDIIVQQCDASGHQVLFNRRDGLEGNICLRHDVDGIVWNLAENEPTHTATLNAFGYIQSSKTRRLWSGCCPDRSYACIVDNNHIFVYWQSVAVSGDLVNRKSSSRVTHVAKQQILKLDTTKTIVGVAPTNKFLFILTTDEIHVARMSKP